MIWQYGLPRMLIMYIQSHIIPEHINLKFVYTSARCTVPHNTWSNQVTVIKNLSKVWRRKRAWHYR
jgi:hypothetical protein